jgi:hypothetical protein
MQGKADEPHAAAKQQQQRDAQECVNVLAGLHLKPLLVDAAETVAGEEIAREVSERCSDCFHTACLAALQDWLLQTLVPWADFIIHARGVCTSSTASTGGDPTLSPLPSWPQRLQRRLAQCFIACRTPQLFDMVKECVLYPSRIAEA